TVAQVSEQWEPTEPPVLSSAIAREGIYFRCPKPSLDTRGRNRANVNLWYRAGCSCPQTEVPNGVQGVAGSNPAVPTTLIHYGRRICGAAGNGGLFVPVHTSVH